MEQLSLAPMKQPFADAATLRQRRSERVKSASGFAAGTLILGLFVSGIAATEAGPVEVERTSPSIARFEMSDPWATLTFGVVVLVVVVAVVTAPFVVLASLLHRKIRSRAVDACSGVMVVVAAGVAALVAARSFDVDAFNDTSFDVTRTHVEVTTARLSARFGLDDRSVRRVALEEIGIVDLRFDPEDEEASPRARASIVLRDGETITMGGSEYNVRGTGQLARTIATAASVDMRCFERSERQRCDVVEAAVLGSAG